MAVNKQRGSRRGKGVSGEGNQRCQGEGKARGGEAMMQEERNKGKMERK